MPDYPHILSGLIAVVRRAGQLITDDMRRPQGPRGGGHKAEVDAEVEAIILDFLESLEGTASWGISCEEVWARRRHCTDREGHFWFLDPNDGTAAYLKGFRGSSVSVGLVRDGVPVLGVVYAPWSPQGQSELYAWCEGLEDPGCNGVKPARLGNDAALDAGCLIANSQSADTKAEANEVACAPARYLTFPGIAYRLAMVASGVADACLSLNGPTGWDLVGGHALLIGAGLDLYGKDGNPLRYGRDGEVRGDTSWVFGGPKTVCHTLASRNWDRVIGGSKSREPRLPLRKPSLAWRCTDEVFVSRAQGALLGLLVGDALGQLVEFQNAASIAERYPDGVRDMADGGTFNLLAGQPTDDGEMALHQARALLDSGDPGDLLALSRAYLDWHKSKPFDIGVTTRQALYCLEDELQLSSPDPYAAVQRRGSDSSQANGAMMRLAPLAITISRLPTPEIVRLANREAGLTHPNPVPRMANVLAALILSRLLHGRELPDALVELADAAAPHVSEAEVRALDTILKWQDEPFDADAPLDTLAGWVKHALRLSLYHLGHDSSFEDALIHSIGRGGDTDTNGAIVGMFLGARHGVRAIPDRWKWCVLSMRPLTASSVRRNRPRSCWPVDALILAEHLAHLAGKLVT